MQCKTTKTNSVILLARWVGNLQPAPGLTLTVFLDHGWANFSNKAQRVNILGICIVIGSVQSTLLLLHKSSHMLWMCEHGYVLIKLLFTKIGYSLPTPGLDSCALVVHFLSCSLNTEQFKKWDFVIPDKTGTVRAWQSVSSLTLGSSCWCKI